MFNTNNADHQRLSSLMTYWRYISKLLLLLFVVAAAAVVTYTRQFWRSLKTFLFGQWGHGAV